jgi:hypothetical protein
MRRITYTYVEEGHAERAKGLKARENRQEKLVQAYDAEQEVKTHMQSGGISYVDHSGRNIWGNFWIKNETSYSRFIRIQTYDGKSRLASGKEKLNSKKKIN